MVGGGLFLGMRISFKHGQGSDSRLPSAEPNVTGLSLWNLCDAGRNCGL
jgi:hypothetical protein